MGLGNWLKRKMAAIALATARVEEDMLSQTGQGLDGGTGQIQRLNQGRLSDSLQRGEITQEVKELRWRMYKVMKATDGVTAQIVGYDEDGMPIVEVKKSNRRPLKNIKVDSEDDYKVIMVVDNSEIMMGTGGGSDSEALVGIDGDTSVDKDGDETKTIAEIDFNNHLSNIKSSRPIAAIRDFKPKFELENYTKRLVVRKIDDNERLLEFYISKYPDEYDRKTRLLISEIKKAINNPRACDSLDIKGINYITDKTMGANDYELYEYEITGFHKIIEYDGHYVIKLRAKITTDGENVIEKFRELDLDERYNNKEAK